MPSRIPESSLHPKISLMGTRELLPLSQEEGEAEAELPHSSETLASVFPAQDKPGELQPALKHKGHSSSKPLSKSPSASATANAMGGRTLALQSSLPGKACRAHPTSPQSCRMSAPCSSIGGVGKAGRAPPE